MPSTNASAERFRAAPNQFAAKAAAFIEQARLDAANGLTVAEFGTFAFTLVGLAVAFADEYRAVPGAERKAWIVDAAASLFDALLPLLPLPARLPIVSGILRSVFLAIVDGAVEALLPIVRRAAA